MTTLIHGGDVITPIVPRGLIRDGAVLIDGHRISWIGPAAELSDADSIDRRIDAGGRIIAPGFIDLQLNGANGRLLTGEPSVETVLAMAQVLPRFGCTSFLPTAITAPPDRLEAAARAVAEARRTEHPGAKVLGLHLEGPFINPERAGAHRRDAILPPSTDLLARFWDASEGSLMVLTLAPEMPGAEEVISAALKMGVTVAIGHTEATPERVARAAELGATLVTHLFNAMSPLTSRTPGTVGGALIDGRLTVSVIADGVHVHPVSLNVTIAHKALGGMVLITDGMPPIGTADPHFVLDGQRIDVRDGACYRPDGVLAGSVLTMNLAVRNMHRLVGVPLEGAILMASLNPARIIGLSERKGSLEPGKDADIVVIDQDVNVWMTLVEGQIRFRADGNV